MPPQAPQDKPTEQRGLTPGSRKYAIITVGVLVGAALISYLHHRSSTSPLIGILIVIILAELAATVYYGWIKRAVGFNVGKAGPTSTVTGTWAVLASTVYFLVFLLLAIGFWISASR